MGRVFFLLFFALISLVSIARPWIGVVCAYMVAVLTPQAVWFWDFEGVRPVLWVLLPTSIGIIVGLVRQQFDLAVMRQRTNRYVLVLWICLAISYYFGPYTHVGGPWRFDDADISFATMNKILLLYFMAGLCIDSELKLKTLFYAVAGSAVYLVYWANSQYLSGHVMGRLAGPVDLSGLGIYSDENNFAMLFVVAQAFLWYLGSSFRQAPLRWGTWLIIPFCWHAVFLTASRGGLVGLAVTTLLIALRSRSRLLGLALIPAFLFVYEWQAGPLMKGRADTINQYQTDESAESRLQAWRAAGRMIAAHPLTGVGLASFGPAFPDYSHDHPREAHNTLLQITAQSGVLAGIMYVLIVLTSVTRLWRNGNRMRVRDGPRYGDMQFCINEATLIALCGLVVCSIFLSLQEFEIFYCLNVFANAVLYISRKEADS
ncbi:MAG: O-antigen ligase family protein, partial [Steroidobacteraceae bacterium]